jgi:hypothetical protein
MRLLAGVCFWYAVWLSASAQTDTFYVRLHLKGAGIDTTVTYTAYEGKGGAVHAVLAPAESQRGDTVQRLESAAIYRSNYLAGDGLTVQFISVGKLGQQTREQWLQSLLAKGAKLSAARGTADVERFVGSGVELKYRFRKSAVYRAGFGKGSKASVRINRVEQLRGHALQGFGDYTRVVSGSIRATLVSPAGERLRATGDFRLGLIAPL